MIRDPDPVGHIVAHVYGAVAWQWMLAPVLTITRVPILTHRVSLQGDGTRAFSTYHDECPRAG